MSTNENLFGIDLLIGLFHDRRNGFGIFGNFVYIDQCFGRRCDLGHQFGERFNHFWMLSHGDFWGHHGCKLHHHFLLLT
ncbi:hypothetical protein D3C72_2184680 [compost metagenome]